MPHIVGHFNPKMFVHVVCCLPYFGGTPPRFKLGESRFKRSLGHLDKFPLMRGRFEVANNVGVGAVRPITAYARTDVHVHAVAYLCNATAGTTGIIVDGGTG